jgi:hypothetical protein
MYRYTFSQALLALAAGDRNEPGFFNVQVGHAAKRTSSTTPWPASLLVVAIQADHQHRFVHTGYCKLESTR